MVSEMKDLTEENRHLRKIYAEMSMQNELLKVALGKKRYDHLCARQIIDYS